MWAANLENWALGWFLRRIPDGYRLARNSDIFAAGVDFHGVRDWSARGIFRGGPGGQEGGGPPDRAEAMRLAFESSPNASIKSWKSPVLLIQGDDDRNVDFSQMVDLVQRLREQKSPV